MLSDLFDTILEVESTTTFSFSTFILCTLCALVLGVLVAAFYRFRNHSSKSFLLTLTLLPAIVQLVIMLVNGNLGTGIAVMGAFSLVRFRSVAGTAKEICSIFLAMAVGLACGMGYLALAALFTLIIGGVNMLFTASGIGSKPSSERHLRIIIPESLEYTEVFQEIFQHYTQRCELQQIKTTNMGSLFRLDYNIVLKNPQEEKKLIDAIRCRNGNLEITCGSVGAGQESL